MPSYPFDRDKFDEQKYPDYLDVYNRRFVAAVGGGESGSGNIVFAPFKITGAIESEHNASGALIYAPLSIIGAAGVAHDATGAVDFAPFKIIGAASTTKEASGNIVFAPYAIVGSAEALSPMTGVIGFTSGHFKITGAVDSEHDASGNVVFDPYVIVGAAGVEHDANGVVAFSSGHWKVTGTVGTADNASGSIVFAPYVITGAVESEHDASGSIVFSPYSIVGAAQALSPMTGVIGLDPYAITGAVDSEHDVSGNIVFDPYAIVGAAGVEHDASGNIVFAPYGIVGAAQALSPMTGAVDFAPFKIVGTANNNPVASGNVIFAPYAITGAVDTEHDGSGNVVFDPYAIIGAAQALSPMTGVVGFDPYAIVGAVDSEHDGSGDVVFGSGHFSITGSVDSEHDASGAVAFAAGHWAVIGAAASFSPASGNIIFAPYTITGAVDSEHDASGTPNFAPYAITGAVDSEHDASGTLNFAPYAIVGTAERDPVFNPTNTGHAQQWHDPSQVLTVTLNGADVSDINDLSGNANHSEQATAASQPVYNTTGINGNNTITFNPAAAEFLNLDASDKDGTTVDNTFHDSVQGFVGSGGSFWMGVQLDSTNSDNQLLFRWSNGRPTLAIETDAGFSFLRSFTGTDHKEETDSPVTEDTFITLATDYHADVGNRSILYEDNSVATSSEATGPSTEAPFSNAPGKMRISADGSNGFSGEYCGHVVFDDILTSGERTSMQSFYDNLYQGFNASGNVVFAPYGVVGAVDSEHDASGNVVFDPYAITGAVDSEHDASGNVVFDSYSIVGTAASFSPASGNIVFTPHAITGAVDSEHDASGTPVFAPYAITGAVDSEHDASGTLNFAPYVTEGSANAGSGFTDPADIASCVQYIDPSISGSITLNGADVSEAEDLTTNTNNMQQDTAAEQPVYNTTGINGNNTIAIVTSANEHIFLDGPEKDGTTIDNTFDGGGSWWLAVEVDTSDEANKITSLWAANRPRFRITSGEKAEFLMSWSGTNHEEQATRTETLGVFTTYGFDYNASTAGNTADIYGDNVLLTSTEDAGPSTGTRQANASDQISTPLRGNNGTIMEFCGQCVFDAIITSGDRGDVQAFYENLYVP